METKNENPVKILLADDDLDDQELFEEALRASELNAEFITVSDGNKLLKHLASLDGKFPDIIFLDINMPLKNGKECLKIIRSNRKFEQVPIIMFSTSSYSQDIQETFTNGANLYISKAIFFKDEVKILKEIFAPNWQKELLIPDKARFVLLTLIA